MPILTNVTCFRQYRVITSQTPWESYEIVQKLKHLCVPELVLFLDYKKKKRQKQMLM